MTDQPNACGGCTACCTIMRVEMDPVKEPWQRCPHECARGCAIYADRPAPCREWSCLWLHSQQRPDVPAMPGGMRPDRSGVVLNVNSVGTILAHCASPAAWQREPVRRWLVGRAGRGQVVILVRPEAAALLLHGDGSTEELRDSGVVDPATNERRYIRAAQK